MVRPSVGRIAPISCGLQTTSQREDMVPVTIKGVSPKVRKKNFNRDRAEDTARRMAVFVQKARLLGRVDVNAIAAFLNETGERNWNGDEFSYGATYRLLRKLNQLGLSKGPRSV